MTFTPKLRSVVTGIGSYLPERCLTNAELARMVDTSDEWIVERTGIRERHVGGSTVGLSVESGRMALESAGLEPGQIDALVDRKSTRLNSSHIPLSRMPSSA